jgi:hypothetical protein
VGEGDLGARRALRSGSGGAGREVGERLTCAARWDAEMGRTTAAAGGAGGAREGPRSAGGGQGQGRECGGQWGMERLTR